MTPCLKMKKVLIVCFIFASVTTFIQYIDFGKEDQKSELPLLFRAVDSNYLTNDFYVNAASEFGPRYFYSRFIAAISTKNSLPFTCFFLTLLINISIVLVTFFFAKDLFAGSFRAGLLAALFVMSIQTFNMGSLEYVYARQLLSSTLVIPFVFLAVWSAFRHRPWICAIAAGTATLVHPTFGAEAGGLAFFAMILSGILRNRKKVSFYIKKHALNIGGAALILVIFISIPLIPYLSSPHIDSQQFIDIETRFRHPHHNLLGYLNDIDLAMYFFITVGLVWTFWSREKNTPKHLSFTFLFIAIFIFFLCLLGLLFVEVFPMKIWGIARPFRLFFVFKWMGLVLIAGFLSENIYKKGTGKIRPEFVYLLVSMLSPLTMVVAQFVKHMKRGTRHLSSYFKTVYSSLILTAVFMAYLIFIWKPNLKIFGSFLFFVILFLLFLSRAKTWIFGAVYTLVILVMLGLSLNHAGPKITFLNTTGDVAQLARFARQNTEVNSVFLTPPDFGLFRMMAERSIVVNWRSFPFQGPAMVEWKERMEDSYGLTQSIGQQARNDMRENYRHINDKKIRSLQSKYGITHCILFKESESRFPVVFGGKNYKIVFLNGTNGYIPEISAAQARLR